MRRKYFKMLEREGEEVPRRDGKGSTSGDEEEIEEEGNTNEIPSDAEDGDSNDEGFFEEAQKPKKSAKSDSKVAEAKNQKNKVKALTHVEKMHLIKERKRQRKEEVEEKTRVRKADREQKEKTRKKNKEIMNQFTRKGQPKMGPRITRLLDQIKDL